MTICPFMSRPVAATLPNRPSIISEVTCKRETCAAWGPVGRTLPGAAINGCRLIGGEVRP